MPLDHITTDELIKKFGSHLPIEVATLIFNSPDGETVEELRNKIDGFMAPPSPLEGEELRIAIFNTTKDLVTKFLYYDRRDDEDMPRGLIEKSIEEGLISTDDIITIFSGELRSKIFD